MYLSVASGNSDQLYQVSKAQRDTHYGFMIHQEARLANCTETAGTRWTFCEINDTFSFLFLVYTVYVFFTREICIQVTGILWQEK